MRAGGGSPKSTNVGSKILLVEDDAAQRDSVAAVLTREGLEVLAADEGRKALELMETLRPEVVLLDLQMAGMDGREFRTQQKRRGRLARIPVVVMTGHPDPSVDADTVLAKPFTAEDLLSAVARFVPGLQTRLSQRAASPV